MTPNSRKPWLFRDCENQITSQTLSRFVCRRYLTWRVPPIEPDLEQNLAKTNPSLKASISPLIPSPRLFAVQVWKTVPGHGPKRNLNFIALASSSSLIFHHQRWCDKLRYSLNSDILDTNPCLFAKSDVVNQRRIWNLTNEFRWFAFAVWGVRGRRSRQLLVCQCKPLSKRDFWMDRAWLNKWRAWWVGMKGWTRRFMDFWIRSVIWRGRTKRWRKIWRKTKIWWYSDQKSIAITG